MFTRGYVEIPWYQQLAVSTPVVRSLQPEDLGLGDPFSEGWGPWPLEAGRSLGLGTLILFINGRTPVII